MRTLWALALARSINAIIVALPALLTSTPSIAYPIDGYAMTGIKRLEAAHMIQEGKYSGSRQPEGALLPLRDVDLRLLNHRNVTLPDPDPELSRQVISLLGDRAANYQVAVLDLTDPEHLRLGVHREDIAQNVGSVGKLVVALGLFQALADIYPDDIDARKAVLRQSQITADDFILTDHHPVAMWDSANATLTKRPLAIGDVGSMWEFLDWMVSASSNAAASMTIAHAMLLKSFGRTYPAAANQADFFAATSKADLGHLLVDTLQTPVVRNGLDLDQIRQGSFFTRGGNLVVPAMTSYATTRSLLQYLLKMEQGLLVDEFSSREIKRLLYSTERRIRYASSPALNGSAVYFKSGSLYQCRPEPGFRCLKYRGNVKNLMNSVAVVESTVGDRRVHYMVALLSNVLRRNSAVDHQTLATGIHELLTTGRISKATALARSEDELARISAEEFNEPD